MIYKFIEIVLKPFEKLLNSKLFNYFTLLLTLLMSTALIFLPFYISKSFQIEVPKGINYTIIFVYGYLVIKIINNFFETSPSNLKNVSKTINSSSYTDAMYEQLQRKVYDDFLNKLRS